MDVSLQLIGWLAGGDAPLPETMMELPTCPVCKEGRLLPFSDEKKPYSFWVCCGHACGYTIGRNMVEETFYKGIAATEAVEKGAKRWVKYTF
ncbi:MAG TPA: hypothetical protein VF170_03635 [Planctomycetaceae bacterium]